jgi:RNA polymerase primary sigma factor
MGKMRDLKITESYTNRTRVTELYLSEVSQIKMLTPDEEYEVAVRAAAGDPAAVDRLVRANLRFVISVAKQYSNSDKLIDDLISQGNIGLFHAAQTFDPSRGFKFISYAVWHIRKEILKYLAEIKSQIRLPQNVQRNLRKVKDVESTLFAKFGRAPNDFEIVEALEAHGFEISLDKLKKNRESQRRVIPLEQFGSDRDDMASPIDWIESGDDADGKTVDSDREVLIKMIRGILPANSAEIVLLRHGIITKEEESFAMIAERYGRSPEWARLAYGSALRKLKRRPTQLALKKQLG